MDSGVSLQKPSVCPELPLLPVCGTSGFGLVCLCAKTMSHLRLNSQHLAKALQRRLREDRKETKSNRLEGKREGRERHRKVEDAEEAAVQEVTVPRRAWGYRYGMELGVHPLFQRTQRLLLQGDLISSQFLARAVVSSHESARFPCPGRRAQRASLPATPPPCLPVVTGQGRKLHSSRNKYLLRAAPASRTILFSSLTNPLIEDKASVNLLYKGSHKISRNVPTAPMYQTNKRLGTAMERCCLFEMAPEAGRDR